MWRSVIVVGVLGMGLVAPDGVVAGAVEPPEVVDRMIVAPAAVDGLRQRIDPGEPEGEPGGDEDAPQDRQRDRDSQTDEGDGDENDGDGRFPWVWVAAGGVAVVVAAAAGRQVQRRRQVRRVHEHVDARAGSHEPSTVGDAADTAPPVIRLEPHSGSTTVSAEEVRG